MTWESPKWERKHNKLKYFQKYPTFCLTRVVVFANIYEQAKEKPFTISVRDMVLTSQSLVYDKDNR